MLTCDQDHLAIESSTESLRCAWGDIRSIHAVKQDTFNPEILNVIVTTDQGDFTFSEENVVNFPSFQSAIRQFLPGVVPFETWYTQATALETRLEEIAVFVRKSSPRTR